MLAEVTHKRQGGGCFGAAACVPVLRIERAHLQGLEAQCEAWPKLLKPGRHAPLLSLGIDLLLEDVAMVAEEDEIALVVHGDDLPAAELGVVRHQAS